MANEAAPARPTSLGTDTPFGKARSMVFPRSVLAGHGVLSEIGTLCRSFDFPERGIVVTGPRTAALAGNRAAEILAESGFAISTLISREPTLGEVDRVAAEVQSAQGRFLVAVGGGSKIDITKVVAARLKIPFVSVPTSAAHDGISSPRASLHDVERVTLGQVQDIPVWRHRLYSSAGAPIIDAVRSVALPAVTTKAVGRRVPKRLDHLFWNLNRLALDTDRDGKLIANRLLSSDDTEGLGFLATGAIPPAELSRAAATSGIDPSLAAMARNIAADLR